MDELFEALCLVQTRKMPKMPIVLVGRDWWQKLINWDFFVEEGVIDAGDLELFHMVDTAQEAMDAIYSFYGGGVPPASDNV
jgi:predicted Rossmann-fold nucleotide-binding protein